MKTLKIGAFAILGLLAVACNDDDEKTAKLTSQEQAEMVASSMGKTGFTGSAEQSAGYADDASTSGKIEECGFENSGTFDFGGTIGEIVFDLDYTYSIVLNCTNDEPRSFTATLNYEGSYDGPRFESEYKGNGSLTITSLSEDEDEFTINGSYTRSGDFAAKVDGEITEEGSHSISIKAKDVMVDKSEHEVMSGTASIKASGRIDGRGSYSFDASVTFNNNELSKMAVIKVSGDTYHLNLENNTLLKIEE